MSMSILGDYFRQHLESLQPEQIQQKKEEEAKEETFDLNILKAEDVFKTILPVIDSDEIFIMNYLGKQGSGKSESAAEFGTISKEHGFLLIYGKAEDIMIDLPQWIEKVSAKIIEANTKYIFFCLDDWSYATGTVSSQKSARWKHFVGNIRHEFKDILFKGYKPHIFLIFISHRYHSVPPIMRNSATWIFSSMESQDREDAQKLVTKNKEQLMRLDEVYQFVKEATSLGPVHKNLTFYKNDAKSTFRWGTKEDYGDGRITMIYHQGNIELFNPRKKENRIDLEDYRIKYVPPTAEELEQKETKKKSNFKKKAEEITAKLNKKETMAIVPYEKNTSL